MIRKEGGRGAEWEDQVVNAVEVRRCLTGGEEMTGQEEEVSIQWERDGLEVLWFPGLDYVMVFDTTARGSRY